MFTSYTEPNPYPPCLDNIDRCFALLLLPRSNQLVCMRAGGICVLEKILPNIPDPTVVQPINEGWSALKEIDEVLGGFTCDNIQPLKQLGDCTDTSFKLCLCIPCCESPATSLVFDGQTDYILNKPAGLKGLPFGPKVKTVESLFITDERSRCQRLCGCKKGKWTIYHGNTVVAKVLKGKKPCTCAGYYKMVDADGVLLSRIKISPTFCECLTQTCRKCTCQCCCLCRLCDCIRCKCCRTKPYLRIQAPTRKEEMMVRFKRRLENVTHRFLVVLDQSWSRPRLCCVSGVQQGQVLQEAQGQDHVPHALRSRPRRSGDR